MRIVLAIWRGYEFILNYLLVRWLQFPQANKASNRIYNEYLSRAVKAETLIET